MSPPLMNVDANKLRDLNLTSDEISRLEKAFSDEKFKELLSEYLKDLQDPEKQKIFENEIVEFEKQRGNDVLFIKPTPHYVLKTSVQGNAKAFINILSCANINQQTFMPAVENSVNGLHVAIPYSLSPVRKICDNRKGTCYIYSIVFHPKTLEQAESNSRLKKTINETAFSAIEKTFKVNLDKINVRISKKSFKGALESTIIRKNCSDKKETNTIVVSNGKNMQSSISSNDEYMKPSYKIVYQNEIDLQNSRTDKFCKMNVLVPKLMIVEIQLPLLKSIAESKLEVRNTSIQFLNEHPKYKLDLILPYEVLDEQGNAKFNADSKVLTIELPVKLKQSEVLLNDGCDRKKLISEFNENVPKQLVTEIHSINNEIIGAKNTENSENRISTSIEDDNKTDENLFLNPDTKYKLPSFKCNYLKNRLAFTLNVKNVVKTSFEYLSVKNGVWAKFSSLGSGHFSMYYSFYISFASPVICSSTKAVDYKINDDHVFIYVTLNNNFPPLEYFVGLDEKTKQKFYLNELEALKLELNKKKPNENEVDIEVSEFSKERVVINLKSKKKQKNEPELEEANEKLDIDSKEEFIFHPQKPVDKKISKLGSKFRTQFSLEEESHSLSESELSSARLNSSQTSQTETHSDVENQSWIVESKNAKKTKRKKKVRNKIKTPENTKNIDTKTPEKLDEEEREELCNSVSEPIDIKSAYMYSDLTSRSILKKHRSFSESSGDEAFGLEYSRSYSVDEINYSSDSYSASYPRKTVTFNDVISKKVFSSNISIMEQQKRAKRRNQRKERRSSESENSETENSISIDEKRQNIRSYNEALFLENAETESTSVSESGGETSDDQSDNPDTDRVSKVQVVPCSKKNHKKRGKKSARKNASTAKHRYHVD